MKHLTLLSIASLFTLTTGCIIGTGGTDSDTDTASTTAGTTDGTTASTTAGTAATTTTTAGTATDAMTSTATDATTEGTTAGTTTEGTSSTTSQESTSTTDGTTDGTTGGPVGCGWNANPGAEFYDCAPGGEPGLEDPMMLAPISCPDQKLEDGEPCVDVDNLGCCDAESNLWYCESDVLVFQMCI